MTRRVYVLAAIAVMISLFAFASAVSATHKKGGEGCSPGYYKNHTVTGSALLFETVFEDTATTSSTTTLQQATDLKGGAPNNLIRHAAAAYLNTLNLDEYLFHTADVVAMFNAAHPSGDMEGTKDLFEAQEDGSDDIDCPLN